MEFAHPWRLLALTIPVFVLVLIAWSDRRRRGDWLRLAQTGQPPRAVGSRAWRVAALSLIAIALAQPRWGNPRAEAAPAPGHDAVLIVDVSRSMAAEDAPPSRLALAIQTALSLIDWLAADNRQGARHRLALVAFAKRAQVLCPITDDLGAVATSLRGLRAGLLSPGATDLAVGLRAALDRFPATDAQLSSSASPPRSIWLFTDGEDLEDAWPSMIDPLRTSGVAVHTLTFGDDQRDCLIPLTPTSPAGQTVLTHLDQPVRTRRRDTAARAIALQTGGAFLPIGAAQADLGVLFQQRLAALSSRAGDRAAAADSTRRLRPEQFAVPTLLALACFLGGIPWPRRSARASSRLVALAWLISCASLIGAAEPDLAPRTARRWTLRGLEDAREGRWDDALRAFEQARAGDPDDPVGLYNTAAALYQLDRPAEAAQRYELAARTADARLQVKILFGLGNSALTLGDLDIARRWYTQCIATRATAQGLDQVRQDAAFNLRFVEELQRRNRDRTEQAEKSSSSSGSNTQRPAAAKGSSTAEPRPSSGTGPTSNPTEVGKPAGLENRDRPGDGGLAGSSAANTEFDGREMPRESDSPDQRLEAALKTIQLQRDRRIAPTPPGSFSTGRERDW